MYAIVKKNKKKIKESDIKAKDIYDHKDVKLDEDEKFEKIKVVIIK